jgi:phosphatidylserine/phosphatidylglycerophosphate/cardiolipin synthase-like enzyme
MSFLLDNATAAAKNLQDTVANTANLGNVRSKLGLGDVADAVGGMMGKKDPSLKHRYSSSAPISQGNNVKFHVDGCAYFWAVSEALEKVKELVWIHGCECRLLHSVIHKGNGRLTFLFMMGFTRSLLQATLIGK